jgi:hypothetical protein
MIPYRFVVHDGFVFGVRVLEKTRPLYQLVRIWESKTTLLPAEISAQSGKSAHGTEKAPPRREKARTEGKKRPHGGKKRARNGKSAPSVGKSAHGVEKAPPGWERGLRDGGGLGMGRMGLRGPI